jgi:hypothetical protein
MMPASRLAAPRLVMPPSHRTSPRLVVAACISPHLDSAQLISPRDDAIISPRAGAILSPRRRRRCRSPRTPSPPSAPRRPTPRPTRPRRSAPPPAAPCLPPHALAQPSWGPSVLSVLLVREGSWHTLLAHPENRKRSGRGGRIAERAQHAQAAAPGSPAGHAPPDLGRLKATHVAAQVPPHCASFVMTSSSRRCRLAAS